jgi:hypothetical protein
LIEIKLNHPSEAQLRPLAFWLYLAQTHAFNDETLGVRLVYTRYDESGVHKPEETGGA